MYAPVYLLSFLLFYASIVQGKDGGCSPNESYLQCFKFNPSDLVYPKNVGAFMEQQLKFLEESDLGDIKVRERKSVSDILVSYQRDEYLKMGEYLKFNQGSQFPYYVGDMLPSSINAANFAILLSPKADFPITVYRGQGCTLSWIQEPYRFWSTTFDPFLAKNWGKDGCVVEVKIPPGFPLLFLNAATKSMSSENEFTLPSHALNKKGRLIFVTYEIVNETKDKELVKRIFLPNQTEQERKTTARTFTVRPASDLLTFDKGTESFNDYEKRYRKFVCAPKNLYLHHSYLEEMCEVAMQVKAPKRPAKR